MSEFENERIRGLPERLPSGEAILWRGSPAWRTLAWRAFHIREALVWFALVAGVRIVADLAAGGRVSDAVMQQTALLPACALAVALLAGLAKLSARTTIYTITERRIVMRVGIALPITINIPHAKIGDATLRLQSNGIGDLGVAFMDGTRLAWLVLWPHCRPWRVRHPEPTLRAIPDAARVADLLTGALAASAAPGGFVRAAAETPRKTRDLGAALPGSVGATT